MASLSLGYNDVRAGALCLAVVFYGLGGTPTPENFTLVEGLVGALIVLGIGPSGFYQVFFKARPDAVHRAGQVLCLYALTVPVGQALLNGNNILWAVRDVIPFLFLLLPLFLADLFAQKSRYQAMLLGAVLIAGLAFAVRAFFPVLGWAVIDSSVAYISHVDPYYLVNAPTVLFAALFLIGSAGALLYKGLTVRSVIGALGLTAVAVVPFVAMAWVMQRASLGGAALVVLLWLVIAFIRAPRRALVPLAALVLAGLIVAPFLELTLQVLADKTIVVGLNSRWREIVAVADAISRVPFDVLWGLGWGAGFSSPAVGELFVNFTHSLLTSYALKTGLIGVVLVTIYLGLIGLRLWPLAFRHLILAGALALPFVIDVLFYASFKSLDFGLLLLLITVLHRKENPAR